MDHDNITYHEGPYQMVHADGHKLFPRVVLLQIYYYLDIKSLFNCSLVNKHFNKLFNSDILWDKLIWNCYDIDNIDQIKLNYNIDESKLIYKSIGNLLNISKIFHMTEIIKELVNLQALNLYKKTLTRLPTEIGSLVNLQELHLDNNQLTSLPKEIGALVNLHTLCLNDNKLSKLPKEIGSLVSLQYLYAINNQLESIPNEIGYLVNLMELCLSDNQLTELPKEIGSLINLQHMCANNNQLISLPCEIESLINLQELHLTGNKLTDEEVTVSVNTEVFY